MPFPYVKSTGLSTGMCGRLRVLRSLQKRCSVCTGVRSFRRLLLLLLLPPLHLNTASACARTRCAAKLALPAPHESLHTERHGCHNSSKKFTQNCQLLRILRGAGSFSMPAIQQTCVPPYMQQLPGCQHARAPPVSEIAGAPSLHAVAGNVDLHLHIPPMGHLLF